MTYDVSLGIMAYNEAGNMGRLLEALLRQRSSRSRLTEIIVVASGCTDGTEGIVGEFQEKDRRITLIREPVRRGKAAAINLFLGAATGDILVLESADTIPDEDTVDNLVAPFADPAVGMTGARPVPVNDESTFVGFAVHLLWRLHHCIALNNPKLGEMVAFRNFVCHIPEDSAVDEASIESIVTGARYRLHYVPEAVVRNKGPETIGDFLRQRRRIAAGHRKLALENRYEVSTTRSGTILKALLAQHRWGIRETIWTAGTVLLEMIGRLLGYYDFHVLKKNPYMWDIAGTTKKLE